MSNSKPIIGVTMGDYNGIGPEVIIKALDDNRMLAFCTPVIFGSTRLLSYHKNVIENQTLNYSRCRAPEDAREDQVNVFNCWEEELHIKIGEGTADSGKYALIALHQAADALGAGKIQGLVTAPVSKAAIQLNDPTFIGQTEFMMQKAGASEVLMVLSHEDLQVALVTGHKALRDVPNAVNKNLALTKLQLFHNSLRRDFLVNKPRIAVLSLNPHAGEQGAMGHEEAEHISPAITEARNKNILAFGPFAADGFFGTQGYKEYDGVLAMYHDQGLTPFKTLAFNEGVNFTAGLPFVRTSPDHGTGFSIAGKNIASPESLRQAIFTAIRIVRNRLSFGEMHVNPLRRSEVGAEES
jgi:4-hydroxythreonine-4-phosphate dehydrogenase